LSVSATDAVIGFSINTCLPAINAFLANGNGCVPKWHQQPICIIDDVIRVFYPFTDGNTLAKTARRSGSQYRL
jgi:hypothetical protein